MLRFFSSFFLLSLFLGSSSFLFAGQGDLEDPSLDLRSEFEITKRERVIEFLRTSGVSLLRLSSSAAVGGLSSLGYLAFSWMSCFETDIETTQYCETGYYRDAIIFGGVLYVISHVTADIVIREHSLKQIKEVIQQAEGQDEEQGGRESFFRKLRRFLF